MKKYNRLLAAAALACAGFCGTGARAQVTQDQGNNAFVQTLTHANTALAAIIRIANTTTYTVNTGWNTASSAATAVFTFANVCRVPGGVAKIPEIDFYSSANPTAKLQGILWLFNTTPSVVFQDDAGVNIAAADFPSLTGSMGGFAFTLTTPQSSGAANSGVSITGSYEAQCAAGSTSLFGEVQVVNAYVPASHEVLSINLHSLSEN